MLGHALHGTVSMMFSFENFLSKVVVKAMTRKRYNQIPANQVCLPNILSGPSSNSSDSLYLWLSASETKIINTEHTKLDTP